MSSKRTTIHIPAAIVDILDLDRDADSGESLSGRITLIVDRYADIVSRHTPALSEGEWKAVMDVMNGYFAGIGNPDAPRWIWASVSDACTGDLAEKWQIDGPALVEKLRAMDYAAGVAVSEIARRFWSRCPSIGIDDALSQALAVRPKTSPLATA